MTQAVVGAQASVSQQWVDRYLALIGVAAEPPSFAALSRLSRAHLRTVVFENITSLLRRRACGTPVPALDPETVLATWEAGRGGGVCFEVSFMLSRLLVALGYDAHQVLNCKGGFDGRHQAVVVNLDGGRFLIDAGNGSPHFDPIPMNGPVEVHHAGLSYRFRPGEEAEEWVQDRWIDETWTPFFTYNLRPADDQVRQAAYQRHHLPGESFVVSSLTIVRCEEEQVLQLRNHDFTRHTAAGKEKRRVTDPDAYRRLVSEVFRLPAMPVVEAAVAWQENARGLPEPWGLRDDETGQLTPGA